MFQTFSGVIFTMYLIKSSQDPLFENDECLSNYMLVGSCDWTKSSRSSSRVLIGAFPITK